MPEELRGNGPVAEESYAQNRKHRCRDKHHQKRVHDRYQRVIKRLDDESQRDEAFEDASDLQS